MRMMMMLLPLVWASIADCRRDQLSSLQLHFKGNKTEKCRVGAMNTFLMKQKETIENTDVLPESLVLSFQSRQFIYLLDLEYSRWLLKSDEARPRSVLIVDRSERQENIQSHRFYKGTATKLVKSADSAVLAKGWARVLVQVAKDEMQVEGVLKIENKFLNLKISSKMTAKPGEMTFGDAVLLPMTLQSVLSAPSLISNGRLLKEEKRTKAALLSEEGYMEAASFQDEAAEVESLAALLPRSDATIAKNLSNYSVPVKHRVSRKFVCGSDGLPRPYLNETKDMSKSAHGGYPGQLIPLATSHTMSSSKDVDGHWIWGVLGKFRLWEEHEREEKQLPRNKEEEKRNDKRNSDIVSSKTLLESPENLRVLYMGVAVDCGYSAQFGHDVQKVEDSVLSVWNIVSGIYEETFNIALGKTRDFILCLLI
jgi:hypothetical protein